MSVVSEAVHKKPESAPMNIATISAGFEKGDFLVREEQGNRVYFDFFEEVGHRFGLGSLPDLLLPKSHLLIIDIFLLGIQLHLKQGILSHVSRRRKALGRFDECHPRQCEGRHEVQHWNVAHGSFSARIGKPNGGGGEDGKPSQENDHTRKD